MVWGLLASMALGAISKRRQAKADRRFEKRQIEIANREAQDAWDIRQRQASAEMGAQMSLLQGQERADRAGLVSRQDAFGLTKQAEEDEQAQRDRFSKALADFGGVSKEVNLSEAKAKRSGRASKAAKGANVSGTAGRSGRVSGAFRSGANAAVTAGLNQAATTAGMQASLTGYGADLQREFDILGGLQSQGAVVGEAAKRTRNLARYREELGGHEMQALNNQASAQYKRSMAGAQMLGVQPPRKIQIGSPDYGPWRDIAAAADMAGTYYATKGY